MHDKQPSKNFEVGAPTLLQQYLATRCEPCPSCRYDLRGLRGEHCPECGQTLRLRVGLEHPNLGSYIAGLVALATAAGFNMLMLVFFLMIAATVGRPALGLYLTTTFVGGIISTVLLVAWLRWGRWIRRQNARMRLTLVVLSWILPLASLTGMLLAFLNE